MGVVTTITLDKVNTLFPSYNFTNISATSHGVIDTTYIVSDEKQSYILKKYERSIQDKIEEDIKLLEYLKKDGLNVSRYLNSSQNWYLYTKLKGREPKTIQSYHIQALARFMSKFHNASSSFTCKSDFLNNYNLKDMLNYTKKEHYFYYKKLQTIHSYKPTNDGFIHGDIFKDNSVFDKQKIAVFDFIDGGCGSFVFDIAVALLSFNKNSSLSFIHLFLNTYNQTSIQKIEKKELLKTIIIASQFYALLRINKYKNISKAKELI